MGKREPLNQGELEYLQRRKTAGASHRQVAIELQCALETVRKKWQAFRRGQPVRRRGRPPTGVLRQYPAEMIAMAVAIKRDHPHWGPANVRVELRNHFPQACKLPGLSRLAVLFKQVCPGAVQPRHPRAPLQALPSSLRVHQRWQIDAVEKIELRGEEFASVVEIREPLAALMLLSQAYVTTLVAGHTWRKLTLEELRQALRRAFSIWGMPEELQTDHEGVFAGNHLTDFPTPFTLWLVGLHIHHLFSRAGQPTDQAHVERNHRTQGDMSWKDSTFDSAEQLQPVLDLACERYNHDLPSHAGHCHGRPPLSVTPTAVSTGRAYDPALEYERFDLAAVDQFLAAQDPWTRKTDTNGVLWLGGEVYYLTRRHKNQSVTVHYLPETRAFSFTIERNGTILILPAQGLSKAALTGLTPVVLPGVFQYSLPLVGV